MMSLWGGWSSIRFGCPWKLILRIGSENCPTSVLRSWPLIAKPCIGPSLTGRKTISRSWSACLIPRPKIMKYFRGILLRYFKICTNVKRKKYLLHTHIIDCSKDIHFQIGLSTKPQQLSRVNSFLSIIGPLINLIRFHAGTFCSIQIELKKIGHPQTHRKLSQWQLTS